MNSYTVSHLSLLVVLCFINSVRLQHSSEEIHFASHHDSHDFVFPGESNRDIYKDGGLRNRNRNVESEENNEIPINLIQRLNEAEDINDVLLNYVEGEIQDVNNFQLANRFGSVERTAAIVPKPAKCMPTLQSVELKASNDSTLLYLPSCTRVERCGGCCSHSLLSCQPTATETLSFQVMVTQYTGGNKLQLKGKEIILVEQHTKCMCDCIIKQEDCNIFQVYKKQECRCACINIDEKKKCLQKNDTKLWDPKVCKCLCRETRDCSTGYSFDHNKCTCVPVPVRRRFAELNSSKERPFNEQERYDVDTIS